MTPDDIAAAGADLDAALASIASRVAMIREAGGLIHMITWLLEWSGTTDTDPAELELAAQWVELAQLVIDQGPMTTEVADAPRMVVRAALGKVAMLRGERVHLSWIAAMNQTRHNAVRVRAARRGITFDLGWVSASEAREIAWGGPSA